MSMFSQSQMGIWLNTDVRFLNIQSGSELRFAQNDSNWRFLPNSFNQLTASADQGFGGVCKSRSTAYLRDSSTIKPHVQRYPNACSTLSTHAKFKVASDIVSSHYFQCPENEPGAKLTTLDVGCSLQMLKRYLQQSVQELRYVGVDSLPIIDPDILCDVSSADAAQAFKSVNPDVVLALDLLPQLHDSKTQLSATLSRWLKATEEKPSLYVFSIPECHESDEHQLRLSSDQWLALLNEQFIIEDVQAIGFLSAIPYWARKRLPLKPQGWLYRFLKIFKDPLYSSHLLRTFETLLTRIFSRVEMLRHYSHTIVITARPRKSGSALTLVG